jgi:hypothetical protein
VSFLQQTNWTAINCWKLHEAGSLALAQQGPGGVWVEEDGGAPRKPKMVGKRESKKERDLSQVVQQVETGLNLSFVQTA